MGTKKKPAARVSSYSATQVQAVSLCLQQHMLDTHCDELTADEAAQVLADAGVLRNDVGPRPGFNFRQMLRDGRDGLIPMVAGASQKRPNMRWRIERVRWR